MSNLENRGSLIGGDESDRMVVGHSEATPGKAPGIDSFIPPITKVSVRGDGSSLIPAGELHKHYTAAQLEIALIRSKMSKLDQRIADLLEQARKLQGERDDLAKKEKA